MNTPTTSNPMQLMKRKGTTNPHSVKLARVSGFWLCAAISMCLSLPISAKIVHLLPRPHEISAHASEAPFSLHRAVTISDPTSCKILEKVFTDNGCTLEEGATAKVTVRMVEHIDGTHDYELAGFANEAYTLSIRQNEIDITAISPVGVIRAAQTLNQLTEGYEENQAALEALTMKDWPAFKLRGMMHDVGRSFVDIQELKHEIDLVSRFKVDVFHWHLTENQAWRFEVKAYPKLTSSASMTRFPGKFYTQEDCRMLEEYAAERGIIIIPEIDMPGHSAAFERAMGHSMQTDQGVEELKQVLTEVAQVFTRAPYIHIGADEQTIVYPNFLKIVTDKVHELGKKTVAWNPIRGITISKDSGFDMTQMWSTSGRKIAGIPNIDCRYNYTNHFDVFSDLVGIYKSNIYYQSEGSPEVAGFISAPWNDRKTPTQVEIIRQNNIYANLLASTERAWIGGGKQYIEVGGTTLPNSGDEYEEFLDWEKRFLFHKNNSLKDEPIPYVRQTNIRWRITDAFPNGGDQSAVFPPETATEDMLPEFFSFEGRDYGSGIATGAAVYLRHTWGGTIPSFYKNPQLNTTAYAWTYVYSETEQTVGANIEFQNYGRSENDKAPDAGKWDRKGSKIWLNGKEILPPVWANTGKGISSEVDLQNENFTARKPIPVKLQKGWNKVFLKLPYVDANGIRLNKWMFTFVLTDLEGRDAIDGLIYSPSQCLDATAEQVAATISEIENFIRSVVSDEPGFYAKESARELLAVVEEIRSTLKENLGEEARATQLETLSQALNEFKASYPQTPLNLPKVSSATETYAYTLRTPLRDNRYATGKGTGNAMIGEVAVSDASKWKFVERKDRSYDIVNLADGSYISPQSSYNTALKTTSAQPSNGWTLTAADEVGYFIITSGDVQINQTNTGLGSKIYNWGGGTNVSDPGGKYRIEACELPEIPEKPDTPEPVYTQVDLSFPGLTPFRLPDAVAQTLLKATTTTVAIDYTQQETSQVTSLVAATDTTADNSYIAYVTMDGNRYGIRYNDNGGWYTQNAPVVGRHQMVFVSDATKGSYRYFLDGNFGREVSGLNNTACFFSTVNRANAIYVGGFVTSAAKNKYPFAGIIHSVRFFDQALTDNQVQNLYYTDLIPTGILPNPANRQASDKCYDLSGRVVSVMGKGLYIKNGEKFLVR